MVGAAIGAVASVAGAAISSSASSKSAKAQANAAAAATDAQTASADKQIALQREMLAKQLALSAPNREAGTAATNRLMTLLGIQPSQKTVANNNALTGTKGGVPTDEYKAPTTPANDFIDSYSNSKTGAKMTPAEYQAMVTAAQAPGTAASYYNASTGKTMTPAEYQAAAATAQTPTAQTPTAQTPTGGGSNAPQYYAMSEGSGDSAQTVYVDAKTGQKLTEQQLVDQINPNRRAGGGDNPDYYVGSEGQALTYADVRDQALQQVANGGREVTQQQIDQARTAPPTTPTTPSFDTSQWTARDAAPNPNAATYNAADWAANKVQSPVMPNSTQGPNTTTTPYNPEQANDVNPNDPSFGALNTNFKYEGGEFKPGDEYKAPDQFKYAGGPYQAPDQFKYAGGEYKAPDKFSFDKYQAPDAFKYNGVAAPDAYKGPGDFQYNGVAAPDAFKYTGVAAPGEYKQDPFNFEEDPGYKFRLSEGMKALDATAASRGGLLSGNTVRGATDYNQASASQEYGNAFGRYKDTSTMGLNAYNANVNNYDKQFGNQVNAYKTNADTALNAYNSNYNAASNTYKTNADIGYNAYNMNYNNASNAYNTKNAADFAGYNTNYNNAYNAFNTKNNADYTAYNTNYNNRYNAYNTNYANSYNAYNTNRNNIINPLLSIAGYGMQGTTLMNSAAGANASAGSNTYNNLGNSIANNTMAGANAFAAGNNAGANAWTSAFNGLAKNAANLYSNYGSNSNSNGFDPNNELNYTDAQVQQYGGVAPLGD